MKKHAGSNIQRIGLMSHMLLFLGVHVRYDHIMHTIHHFLAAPPPGVLHVLIVPALHVLILLILIRLRVLPCHAHIVQHEAHDSDPSGILHRKIQTPKQASPPLLQNAECTFNDIPCLVSCTCQLRHHPHCHYYFHWCTPSIQKILWGSWWGPGLRSGPLLICLQVNHEPGCCKRG